MVEPPPNTPPHYRPIAFTLGGRNFSVWIANPAYLQAEYANLQALDRKVKAAHPEKESRVAQAFFDKVSDMFGLSLAWNITHGQPVSDQELLKGIKADLLVSGVAERAGIFGANIHDILVGPNVGLYHEASGRKILQVPHEFPLKRGELLKLDAQLVDFTLRRDHYSLYSGLGHNLVGHVAYKLHNLNDGKLSNGDIVRKFGSIDNFIARLRDAQRWFDEGIGTFRLHAGPESTKASVILERLEASPGSIERLTDEGIRLHDKTVKHLHIDDLSREWIQPSSGRDVALLSAEQKKEVKKLLALFEGTDFSTARIYDKIHGRWFYVMDVVAQRTLDQSLARMGWVTDERSLIYSANAPSTITYAYGIPRGTPNAVQCLNLTPIGRARFTEGWREYDSAYEIRFVETQDIEKARFQVYTDPAELKALGADGFATPPQPNILHQRIVVSSRINEQNDPSSILTRNHEIGHAVGLTHPHPEDYSLGIGTYLLPSLDSRINTVMSYNSTGHELESLGPLDYAALDKKYTPKPVNILNTHYILYPDDEMFHTEGVNRTILDRGGRKNIIDARHLNIRAEIDLRNALTSSVRADNHILKLAFSTHIQGVLGSRKDDEFIFAAVPATIFGGNGADTFVVPREACHVQIGDFSAADTLDIATRKGTTAQVTRLKDGAHVLLSDGTKLDIKCDQVGFSKLMQNLAESGVTASKPKQINHAGFTEMTIDNMLSEIQETVHLRKGDPSRINNATPKVPSK